jgi:hypothetical protein
MTLELTPAVVDRLERLLDRFDLAQQTLAAQQRALTPAAVDLGVEVQAMPPHVVAGELIESAWGNNVVDQLQYHDTFIAQHPKVFVGGAQTATSQIQIVSTSWVGTINGAGNATIVFDVPFTWQPVVVASIGLFTSGMIVEIADTVTTTSFNVAVRYLSGAVAANTPVRINYHAVGQA